MRHILPIILSIAVLQSVIGSCNGQSKGMNTVNSKSTAANAKNFTEGKDYTTFERVRLLDKTGFSSPQEAYSILLPKGWTHTDAIIWNAPGTACAGTYRKLKATSADGKFTFEQLPDAIFVWNSNPQMQQFAQSQPSGENCGTMQPMDATQFLNNAMLRRLGNPQIVSSSSNQAVINEMRQMNDKAMQELRGYGAGQMQFYQTALNAQVKWPDGREGLVVFGVSVLETAVPNVYNGSSDMIYTMQITKQTIFTYPAKDAEQGKNLFAMIMSGIHTNPAWNDAVNGYWKNVRQQSNVAHIGRIKMMDEQTRQIGENAIRAGNDRLRNMDNQMRSWEQIQNSQDRMHTEFIKTIREVENYQDASGKYEMTSGYDHAWSRGDGSSFIMTNNPNFDPSSVLQDQQWKEMKKVR